MARINKENAEKLAVSYSAYNAAVDSGNRESAKVWARLLIEAQKATGVELLEERLLWK